MDRFVETFFNISFTLSVAELFTIFAVLSMFFLYECTIEDAGFYVFATQGLTLVTDMTSCALLQENENAGPIND